MHPRHKDIVIRPDDFRIQRYTVALATRPCRAERIIRDSWWVVDVGSRRQPWFQSLVFLDSHSGHIPQQSVDEEIIHIMKRKIFPWAEVKRLDTVYLVRHGREGWQVPYGIIT